MTNNDTLRRLRYTFDYNDNQMIDLFALANMEVSREQVSNWLKPENDEAAIEIKDEELAAFLNGFIANKRGKREGPTPPNEKRLNNNTILRKIKIALNLKDTDMIAIYDSIDFIISKHELSAFFRKPTQRQYRICKDQFLRNFLHGLQIKYRKELL